MQVPLEISYRDVEKTPALENLINESISDLESYYNNIISCRIAIEKPNSMVSTGNPYRVRISLRVPPGHELVVTKDQGDSDPDEPLGAVIRDAFGAAERQLKDLNEKQKNY
jgi:ribosome-associated translation inhibitor RaiA